jgi:ABC-type Fe3+/spermidine/putrescine transport system ATPase subunit
VCPQQNVLFGHMTVYEHLVFYAMIKRVPEGEEHCQVTTKIRQVGLDGRKDYFLRHLLIHQESSSYITRESSSSSFIQGLGFLPACIWIGCRWD